MRRRGRGGQLDVGVDVVGVAQYAALVARHCGRDGHDGRDCCGDVEEEELRPATRPRTAFDNFCLHISWEY